MGRCARLKVEGVEAWYHLCARYAGRHGEYPLADPTVSSKLLKIIKFYTAAYFCDVAAFITMGSHYHLVLRIDVARQVKVGDTSLLGSGLWSYRGPGTSRRGGPS